MTSTSGCASPTRRSSARCWWCGRIRKSADAIDYINQRPAPLVAYWYGPDNDDFRHFVRNTRSGGVARNDFAAQMIPSAAPFGGVGRSGTGAYHGKAGFDAFSHYRTVVGTDLPFTITGRAAPPFSGSMQAGSRSPCGWRAAAPAVGSSAPADRRDQIYDTFPGCCVPEPDFAARVSPCDGAQPHPPSAQALPLIACSRAHR